MSKYTLPNLGTIMVLLQKFKRTYQLVAWLWGFVPPFWKSKILHFANTTVALGAVAVIQDTYTRGPDPRVLLARHKYNERFNIPWGLIGGAVQAQDLEKSDLSNTVRREVLEETGLEVEVVKLLHIDTDWNLQTMDFYFECALRHGPPAILKLEGPEISELGWFRISELPENMMPTHKNVLKKVLPKLPRVPGAFWTANQVPSVGWDKIARAQQSLQQILNLDVAGDLRLAALVNEARNILDCEIVSPFLIEPAFPISIVETSDSILDGQLRLLLESSTLIQGTASNLDVVLKLPPLNPQVPSGLTPWLVRALPLGHAVRLHDKWLQDHPQVISYENQDHLGDGKCHSLAAVAVVGGGKLLGLLKAENKLRENAKVEDEKFTIFSSDDGYVLEQFATAIGYSLNHSTKANA